MSKTETQTETQSEALRLADEFEICNSYKSLPLDRDVTAAAVVLRRLDAENKALRADAERYRWLRRWKGQEHEPPFTVQHEIDGILWGGDLDAAIDAAQAAAKNGGAA